MQSMYLHNFTNWSLFISIPTFWRPFCHMATISVVDRKVTSTMGCIFGCIVTWVQHIALASSTRGFGENVPNAWTKTEQYRGSPEFPRISKRTTIVGVYLITILLHRSLYLRIMGVSVLTARLTDDQTQPSWTRLGNCGLFTHSSVCGTSGPQRP